MENKQKTEAKDTEVTFSYLQNKKVKIVPINKKNPFPQFSLEELNPSTGKYETKKNIPESFNNTFKVISVPISKSSGTIRRVFDNSQKKYTKEYPYLELTEQRFFEMHLGLSEGDLDPVKTVNDGKGGKFQYSYWQNQSGSVKLDSSPLFLDLSKAEDMLKYKVILLNTNPISGIIAPDKNSADNSPKYQYMILDIETEVVNDAKDVQTKTDAFSHYIKYTEGKDIGKLNKLFSLIEGKWQTTEKWDGANVRVFEYVTTSPDKYLEMVNDSNFEEKLLIMKAVKYGELRNTQGIFKTVDGIGTGNFQETVKWIKDPENFARVEKIKERLSKVK